MNQVQPLNIWKLLGSFVLIPSLCTLVPLLLARAGLVGPLHAKAGLMLAVTALGLCFKVVCTDLATGTFDYHKHGHDFCVLTMGASLSAGALQLASSADLFPGFSNVWPWGSLAALTSNTVQQHLIVIFAVFSSSCVFAVLTARISRAVKDESPKYPNLLSLLNFGLGALLFSCNLLLLITKG